MMDGSLQFYAARRKVMCQVLDEYPELPTRTIGRMLHRKHPEYFPTVDIARQAVQYLRGAKGELKRANLKMRKYVTA